MNSLELKDYIHQKVEECRSMVELCKTEKRNMTEDEEKKFDELKQEIEEKKRELQDLEEELKNYEVPSEELEKKSGEEEPSDEEKEEKNKRNNTMKKTLVKELRNAIESNIRSITVQGYTVGEGQSATNVDGVHDNVIETEIQGILEPLYAKSALTELGVKWYKGLPQGDISVPVMGKGQVGWAGEIAEASESSNTFSNITLSPKRLTAFVSISKQLIAQDTIGAEEAIRRDIVNALNDKLEATIFGDAAGDTTKPAGIFNGKTVVKNDTFAKVCAAEAGVETANVFGEMKYLMAPTTKSFYRSLQKGNGVGFVYENNEMDGVKTIVTSNIAANNYVYGNFANLAVGSWGNVEITIDPYTQAAQGCIKLIVNAYFDAKILRNEAFTFGKTVS